MPFNAHSPHFMSFLSRVLPDADGDILQSIASNENIEGPITRMSLYERDVVLWADTHVYRFTGPGALEIIPMTVWDALGLKPQYDAQINTDEISWDALLGDPELYAKLVNDLPTEVSIDRFPDAYARVDERYLNHLLRSEFKKQAGGFGKPLEWQAKESVTYF